MSGHALIEMWRSPLHCWAKYVDPDRADEAPTAAMRFGTLVHALVLTPATFADEFALADSINRRTKDGQAEWAALAATGKQVVTGEEYRTALEIVKAIRRHPVAATLFKTGEPEKILAVEREPHRWPLKGRLDWLAPQPAIVELKTATDASREGFLRAVYRHGYHLSAAYYRMLVGRITGTPEDAIPHTFVVVETKRPHAVAVYPLVRAVAGGGAGAVGDGAGPVRRVLAGRRLARLSGGGAGAGRRWRSPLRGRGRGGRAVSGDRPRRRKGAAVPPPLSDARRRLVAGSRALWVKADGFVENGMCGAHFGASAKEAAATLEAIGDRREPITGVYRRSPATPEFVGRR